MKKKKISITVGVGLVLIPLVIYHKKILREINEASLERHFLRRQFKKLCK